MPQITVTTVNGKVVVNGRTLESWEVLQYRKYSNDTIRFANRERVADLPILPSSLSEVSINGVVPTMFDELDAALLTLFPALPQSSSPGGGSSYLVYTALLSQSQPAPLDSGHDFTIGEQYEITDYTDGDDFSNIAQVISGTINTTGCVFQATGITPATWLGSTITSIGVPYLVSEDSNDNIAPLQNKFGGQLIWKRNGVGQFEAQFPIGLSVEYYKITCFSGGNGIGVSVEFNALQDGLGVYLNTSFLSGGAFVAADGIISYLPIEIRVYP